MALEATNQIFVYAYAKPGKDYPACAFQPGSGRKLVCTITTRFDLRDKLYWSQKHSERTGKIYTILCSTDGHVWDAYSLYDTAHLHRRKSPRDKKHAYLIQSVDFMEDPINV